MSVLVYFYMLILFFGPKLGILDTRMLLLPIGLLLSNGYIYNGRTIRLTFIVLLFLLIYSILIYVSNDFIDPYFLRYFRAIISILAMALLFRSKRIDLPKIINGFFLVFFTHALVMLIMLLIPTIQPYINVMLGNDVSYHYLRVTGLTSGFDISGFITIASAVFAYTFYSSTYKTKYLILMILSVCMTVFTSRANMIYLSILFIFLLRNIFIKSSFSLKNIILFFMFFIIGLFFVYKLILPVFTQTVSSNLLVMSKNAGTDFVMSSYGYTDPIKMLRSFIVLPDSVAGIIFGISKYPKSDSGYIQSINTVGVIGLLISFGFYLKTYRNIRFFYGGLKGQIDNLIVSKVFLNTSTLLFFLTIVASVKNQYFFTRSVFEMYIFCSFVLESIYRQTKQEMKDLLLDD
jgi:hypothetical protein